MTDVPWTRYFAHAAVVAAVAIALTAALVPSSARAAEDESSIWNLDKRMFRGLMRGLGLKGPDDEEIEYRERSPLVVPPSRDLPPPQSANARPAPNWPADPVVATQRSAAPANNLDTEAASRSLMPGELNKGRSTGRRVDPNNQRTGQDSNALLPSQLGFTGFRSFFKRSNVDEVGTFTSEPQRQTLTEPPQGYQIPSPDQPYGVTKRNEYGPARKVEDIPVGR